MKKSISNMVIQRLYFVHCIIMSNYALVSLSRYIMPSDKRFFCRSDVIPTDNRLYECRSDVILQAIVLHPQIHVFK